MGLTRRVTTAEAVDAVDAVIHGENDPVEMLGVKARTRGNMVELVFRGRTVMVAKTRAAVTSTLRGFGVR